MNEKWFKYQYLEKHLSLNEIGKLLGISRVAVWKWSKKFKVDVHTAEWVSVHCATCGREKEIARSQWKRTKQYYCSKQCYFKHMSICSTFQPSRQGCRMGRKVMSQYLRRSLLQGEIVHHIDGNQNNNTKNNLMLFANHSEHIAYHHRLRIIAC